MLQLSRDEIAFILRALFEHKDKIEAMPPYPVKNDDLKTYDDLIHKLATYRDQSLH